MRNLLQLVERVELNSDDNVTEPIGDEYCVIMQLVGELLAARFVRIVNDIFDDAFGF